MPRVIAQPNNSPNFHVAEVGEPVICPCCGYGVALDKRFLQQYSSVICPYCKHVHGGTTYLMEIKQ